MTVAAPLYDAVQQASDIDAASKYYWGYQFRLGQEVLVPWLRRGGFFHPGSAVAEIGCGEAGVLMSFVLAGAGRALGTDIATSRLETARRIAQREGIAVELAHHDIVHDPIPKEWQHRFDLVVLRDVLEHLDNPAEALRRIRQLLRPGSTVFISFPPYPSPYGGHQHLLGTVWGWLPYVHLLPEPVFEWLTASGREPDRTEVRRLRRIRLSLPQMPQLVHTAGYRIVAEAHYLLRPVFRFKWGIPVPAVRLPRWLLRLPRLAQYLCMEAGYVLQWSGES